MSDTGFEPTDGDDLEVDADEFEDAIRRVLSADPDGPDEDGE